MDTFEKSVYGVLGIYTTNAPTDESPHPKKVGLLFKPKFTNELTSGTTAKSVLFVSEALLDLA